MLYIINKIKETNSENIKTKQKFKKKQYDNRNIKQTKEKKKKTIVKISKK